MKIRLTLFAFLLFASLQAQTAYTQNIFSYDSLVNVVYGTAVDYAGNTDTLLMDIYKPHGDGNCLRPIIVLVHGGSWVGGSKADVDLVYLSRNLAAKGWVVANINYRLGTHKAANYTMYAVCNNSISAPCGYISDSSEIFRANFRGMQDAKGAIRFMKNRNAIDSSDVNNVFIAGESAGGFVSFATAFMDQPSEKPIQCFAISNAPTPDPDMSTYGCVPSIISYARPDLGSIDGTLNIGNYDAKVKGIGNFFGGVMNLNIFQQATDTPAVYMYHQGSDVIVTYTQGQILGRISWECYAQTNLCQSYYFYPFAYGSEGIHQYFISLGSSAPVYQCEIVNNYNYMNDCLANGHSIDNVQVRLQNMVNFFSPIITASGNDPVTNCQTLGIHSFVATIPFKVFPNPSSGEFTIECAHSINHPIIRIFSTIGTLLQEEQLSTEQTSILKISTSLPAGSYFMTIDSNGETFTQKLVIAK